MPFDSRRSVVAASLFLLAASIGGLAQTASLVKDINPGVYAWHGSSPAGFTEFNGAVYFSASEKPGDIGLWRTDGSGAGTQLVKNNLDVDEFLVSGGILYLIADDGGSGVELWKSDGTEAGTVIVKDINPGAGNGLHGGLLDLNRILYFSGDDGATGPELWRSDGTTAGTFLVKDLDPSQPGFPVGLTTVGDTLFFSARVQDSGIELWKSDGTEQGTVLVKDINPGTSDGRPDNMVSAGGLLLFRADDGVNGKELWRSDGTPGGTAMIRDIHPGPGSATDFVVEPGLFEVGALAIFAANNDDGLGLWKTDGTFEGTEQLNNELVPVAYQAIGSTLYVLVRSQEPGPLRSLSLWKTDGTTAGTQLVRDLGTGSISGTMVAVGDTLFIDAGSSPTSRYLWTSDGTTVGTVPFEIIGSNSRFEFAGIGDMLYLSVRTDETGQEPWISDGTVEGTRLIKDIGQGPSNGASPNLLTVRSPNGNGGLFFVANDGTHGVEWWKSDGTADGTVLIKDINTTDVSGIYTPGEMLSVGDTVFFTGNDGTNGYELWKTDGTPDGTVMLKDINPQPGESSLPGHFTELNGVVLFVADDPAHGDELWKTDGTPEGTVLLKDISPGALGSLPSQLIRIDDHVIFTADGGENGRAIWTTDGTTAGTVLVSDIYPFEEGPYVDFVGSGDLLYFRADITGPSGAMRLWRSGGRPWDTFLIHTFTPTPTLSFKPWMTDVDGTLFFVQGDGLWKTNGTAQSTMLVKPLDSTSSINSTFGSEGALYFTLRGTDHDELWRSDGTDAGTVVVKQFARPTSPSNQPLLRLIGEEGGALFLSVETADGYQLWRSHGTAESTTAVPNNFLGHVASIASLGPNIYFAAEDSNTGRELWKAPLLPTVAPSGVVDAASFQPTLAPGSLASLFGVELSTSTTSAATLPLPTSLAGARIQVNGVEAPLLFVSPKQINFQVPFETPEGAVSVVAILGEQASANELATVTEFAPRLFVNPATGGPIIQRHPDGALITAENPAKSGDILIIYVTGIGGLENPPPTGAPAIDSPLSYAVAPPTVTVGGVEVLVAFAGLAPGFVGLGQINIELSGELPQGGTLPLVVRFGENVSQPLQLPIQSP